MASRGSVSHRPADVAPGELRTARLVLRAFAPADEAEVVGLWNDPDVGRYRWDGQPVAAARVRAQIAESRRAFAACGIGLYTARPAAAPGAVIGAAGLARIGGQPEPELLYALLPAFWSAVSRPRRRPRSSAWRSRSWASMSCRPGPTRRTSRRSAS
jgi:RimJ/RimL family protein N-acetyltransferase